jgi:hypothetical protein
VADPTKEQHQIVCKSLKDATYRDPGNDEESIRGRQHEPYTESTNPQAPKEVRHVKLNVKGTLIIFFHIKGNVHKEFVQGGQTVNLAITVKFYGDCIKLCEDFMPNFGKKRTD